MILKTAGSSTVELIQDEDALSPSEWADSTAFLCAWSRDCYVAPPREKGRFDPQSVIDQYGKTHWTFPLEAYIHGGVVLALAGTGRFPDRQWDVSENMGAVFCARSEWPRRSKAEKCARSLVDAWNQYLAGDVYGYVIKDNGEHVDSCCGFYGYEYAKSEALAAFDAHVNVIPTLNAQ